MISYVCNHCKARRKLIINHSYHIAKSTGGLTEYNDYHLCVDEKFRPSLVSVDREFNVRGQKVLQDGLGESVLPSPHVPVHKSLLEYSEEFENVFPAITVTSKIKNTEYYFGELSTNPKVLVSPTGVYTISYDLAPEFKMYEVNLAERLEYVLKALDVGQTINLNIISVAIAFVAEHADISPDYVDLQITIDLTRAERIWMKWSCRFSNDYLEHHIPRLFGPGGVSIAKSIMPYLKEGKFSMAEVSEKSGVNLASTVSIAFMMELWGVLDYLR